jgi:DNA repair protein REV1
VLLAKLATRRAKPAGVYHLKPTEIPDFIAPLDVEDFPSIGYSIKGKIEDKFGTTKCGDLLEQSKGALRALLGPKTGDMVWGYLRGIDDRKLEPHKERKSISAEMNVSGIQAQHRVVLRMRAVWYPLSKPRSSRNLYGGSGGRGVEEDEAGRRQRAIVDAKAHVPAPRCAARAAKSEQRLDLDSTCTNSASFWVTDGARHSISHLRSATKVVPQQTRRKS